MKPSLEDSMAAFCQRHVKGEGPILLACSGGADSRALLHLLASSLPFLHVVHINHNVRPESRDEALFVRGLCTQYALPYHEKTLSPVPHGENEENWWREQRWTFFQELYAQLQAQALFVAHHRDDHAETVLKRVLEGAAIDRLYGMQHHSRIRDMQVCRPLLSFSKQELLYFLHVHGLESVEDASNEDTTYLRARMRKEILPQLSQCFGKKVTSSLRRLGERSAALDAYLETQLAPYFQGLLKGPWGILSPTFPSHPFEGEYFLRALVRQQGGQYIHSVGEACMRALMEKAAHKRFVFGGVSCIADRGRCFVLHNFPPVWRQEDVFPIEWGQEYSIGPWSIRFSSQEKKENTSWQGLWQGRARLSLPSKKGLLAASPVFSATHKSRGHCWGNDKVPAFFRSILPVVKTSEGAVYEFLTGRTHPNTPFLLEISWKGKGDVV